VEENEVVVHVLKYDGREHRRWPARIARIDGPLLVLDAVFEDEIEHDLLGTISSGTISTEFYWLDRWYNVFRFLEPDGSVRNFYCNVNMPPRLDGRTLSYIDLDMDILVSPALSYEILDMDEFWINALKYKYPTDVQNRARGALRELVSLIEAREFPFDRKA
jgi:uncharacterized protein